MLTLAPPTSDEFEISVFGPGYGECILLHVGLGEWVIVDSCVNKATGTTPALDHLRAMGVEPSTAVKLVVATHWHDDHVRGISDILTECSQAVFSCSSVMNERDVMSAFRLPDDAPRNKIGPGMRQLRDTLEIVADRYRAGQPAHPFRWADASKDLLRRRGHPNACVRALSPSEKGRLDAVRHFRSYLLQADLAKSLPPSTNHSAVALWIEVGDIRVLLGSDLERHAHPETGWNAIILDPLVRPDYPAELVKVPHHGSPNAHDAGMWEHLLVPDPLAVLCPWQRGGRVRPQQDDIDRICEHSRALWMTAPAEPSPAPAAHYYADSAIGAQDASDMESEAGRVTLRKRLGTPGRWAVDLADPAYCVCTDDAQYA